MKVKLTEAGEELLVACEKMLTKFEGFDNDPPDSWWWWAGEIESEWDALLAAAATARGES